MAPGETISLLLPLERRSSAAPRARSALLNAGYQASLVVRGAWRDQITRSASKAVRG